MAKNGITGGRTSTFISQTKPLAYVYCFCRLNQAL